jgi:hypothetical protein
LVIDFTRARAIAEEVYFAQAELEGFTFEPWVADWGFENEEYFQILAGDKLWLKDGIDDLAPIDDVVRLVDKRTGKYSETTALQILDMLSTFIPVGSVPDSYR